MLARGFTGYLHTMRALRFGAADAWFAAAGVAAPLAVRVALERFAA